MSETNTKIPVRAEIAEQLQTALLEYQARCKAYREFNEIPYAERHPHDTCPIEMEGQKDLAYKHAVSVFELVLASIAVRS